MKTSFVLSTTIINQASAIFLVLALVWFSVGITFNSCSQPFDILNNIESTTDTPEEKIPPSNLFSEEYMHEHHMPHFFIDITAAVHFIEDARNYPAFHGELLVPPPNFSRPGF